MANAIDSSGLRVEELVEEFLAASEQASTVYAPREDSFLMLEALSELDLQGFRVLDMGTGSGILAAYCARRGAAVTASDIDPEAIGALKPMAPCLGIQLKLVESDLFSKIDGQFDLVLFNPPYLPSARVDDRAVDGGKHGTEAVNRFLSEVKLHLAKNGFAMLVASSLNNPEDFAHHHPDLCFDVVRQKPLFFERLYVIRITPRTRAPDSSDQLTL